MEEAKIRVMKSMRNKNRKSENYLERRPMRDEQIKWSVDKKGMVTLNIENTGLINRVVQKVFGKPKVSYIHLDKIGSFVWTLMDGKKNIILLGKLVKEHFGDEAEPLYERLAKYFQILDSYSFICWK